MVAVDGRYIKVTDVGVHYETTISATSDPPENVVNAQIVTSEARLDKLVQRSYDIATRTQKIKPEVTTNSLIVLNTPIVGTPTASKRNTLDFEDNGSAINPNDFKVEDADLGIISFRNTILDTEEVTLQVNGGYATIDLIPTNIKDIALLLFDEVELERKLQIQARETEDVDIGSINLRSTTIKGIKFDLEILRTRIEKQVSELDNSQRSSLG